MKTDLPQRLLSIRHPLGMDEVTPYASEVPSTDRFAHISFKGSRPCRPTPKRETGRAPVNGYSKPLRSARMETFSNMEGAFVQEIISMAGLASSHYRTAPLVRRIPACLRTLKAGSIEDAWAMIRTAPNLVSKAVDSLLIGTTEFFRDEPVFVELQREIVPQLARLSRPPRVWSVACSDGMELYSVAMMLSHHEALEGARLLGTDCRRIAIERARRGGYPVHILEKIPALYRGMFSAGQGTVYLLDDLRASVQWEVADALDPVTETGWDLILCRNFTIYLDPEAATGLWSSLVESLNPGGVLVVGKAEKPVLSGLNREAPSIYRKTLFPAD